MQTETKTKILERVQFILLKIAGIKRSCVKKKKKIRKRFIIDDRAVVEQSAGETFVQARRHTRTMKRTVGERYDGKSDSRTIDALPNSVLRGRRYTSGDHVDDDDDEGTCAHAKQK